MPAPGVAVYRGVLTRHSTPGASPWHSPESREQQVVEGQASDRALGARACSPSSDIP